MTAFTFRPAARSNAKPLIGIYSESGCGKTTSALMLACGFVGGDMSTVGMIETESGRGEALAGHATLGGYRVLSLRDDFSPASYGKAIKAAEQAELRALIIDSASHEWEGTNGVLAMAAENQAAGKKGPLVWQIPKIQHSREFMLRLMQTPIPLVVVCMRAKYPMKEQEIVKGGHRVKEWTRSPDLEPKQADDILFEMFIHGWIDQAHKFHGTKYTLPELRQCLEDDQPITEDSGRRLAEWASGKESTVKGGRVDGSPSDQTGVEPDPRNDGNPATGSDSGRALPGAGSRLPTGEPAITPAQEGTILDLLTAHGVEGRELLAFGDFASIGTIPGRLFVRVCAWIRDDIIKGAGLRTGRTA